MLVYQMIQINVIPKRAWGRKGLPQVQAMAQIALSIVLYDGADPTMLEISVERKEAV